MMATNNKILMCTSLKEGSTNNNKMKTLTNRPHLTEQRSPKPKGKQHLLKMRPRVGVTMKTCFLIN